MNGYEACHEPQEHLDDVWVVRWAGDVPNVGESIGAVWRIGEEIYGGRDHRGAGFGWINPDRGRVGQRIPHPTIEAAAEWLWERAVDQIERDRAAAEKAAERRRKGVIHLQRPPLPWHTPDQRLSMCGRKPRSMARPPEIPAEERYRICQNCHALGAEETWETNPVGVLWLWIGDSHPSRRNRLRLELISLGALFETHRAEFTEHNEAERGLDALMR